MVYDAVAAGTVKVDIFEIEVAGKAFVQDDVAHNYGFAAVGGIFTQHTEALCRSYCAHSIRRAFGANINVVACGHSSQEGLCG